jgi:hypothetical protein
MSKKLSWADAASEPSSGELLSDPVGLAMIHADKLVADDIDAICRRSCRKLHETEAHVVCGDRDRLCRGMCLHDLLMENQTVH